MLREIFSNHYWSAVVGLVQASQPPPRGGLDESQTVAAGQAISGGLTLIHGPPGTGKTRVLATIIESLVGLEKNVLVSAFTHRAIDNVLHAVKILNPGIDVVKLGRRSPDLNPGISTVSPQRLPRIKFSVVGATVYAAMKLSPRLQFDAVVIDEAGQLPLAHSLIPLARTRGSLILAGDHFQLHPVLTGSHGDSFAASSIFAHLAALYPERLFMLRTSYRLPPGLCGFPSKTFYGGALKSHSRTDPDLPSCPPNPRHPEIAPLWRLQGPKRAAWVNHTGYGALSPPEAELTARIVASLIVDLAISPEKIAVVAPHRAQVRETADRLWKHLGAKLASGVIVDTVERMQGQERDVVILSLCASDPWFVSEELDFIMNPNRLNVSITRSRKLLLVVGSRFFFRALPRWPEHIERASLFRQFEADLNPVSFDFTEIAHRWVGLPPPRDIL